MSTQNFKVRVTKDTLVFSAGHFITFNGNICERVHGHNYRVAVEVEGGLDENHYVFDFIALRDSTMAIVSELDHRMLLPDRSPLIKVEREGTNLVARFEDRYWSFPAEECVLLPVPNTTAELIADYIGNRLRQGLVAKGSPLPAVMRIEVEECFGQWGSTEWRRDDVPGKGTGTSEDLGASPLS